VRSKFQFQLPLAFQKFQTGDFLGAEKIYLELLRVEPENPECLYYLALIEIQGSSPDQALGYLAPLAGAFPGKAEILEPFGACLLATNKIPEAIEVLQQVVELNPDSLAARKNLAKAYALSGDRSEAVKWLLSAIKLKPRDGELRLCLARELQTIGKAKEALPHLQSLLQTEPRNTEALFLYAIIHQNQGTLSQARATYLALLEQEPHHSDALNNLG
jgi:predicted Zn-dependent protease